MLRKQELRPRGMRSIAKDERRMTMTRLQRRLSFLVAVALAGGAFLAPVYAQSSSSPGNAADQTQGPPTASPDDAGAPPGGPERRLKRMQKELNLTSEQTAKIKAIFAEGRQHMLDERNNASASQEDRRENMMKTMREQNQKIEAVLDDTQKKKFEAMEARMRQNRRREREAEDDVPLPPPPPDAPPS